MQEVYVLADQSLVNFIKGVLQRGNSKSEIVQVLLKKGWDAQKISDAFEEASRPMEAVRSGSSNKGIWIALGVCVVLFIIVGAVLLLWPSETAPVSTDECERDSDCGYNEVCNRFGDCVLEEAEPDCETDSDCGKDYECEYGSCVKTAECSADSDCGSGYECNLGACEITTTTSTTTATTSYPNYDPTGLDSWSVSGSNVVFKVNVKNNGSATSTKDFYYSCKVTYNGGLNTSTSITKETSNSLDSDDTEAFYCNFDATNLYYGLFDTLTSMQLSLDFSVDVYNNITEENESDNSLLYDATLYKSNFTIMPICVSKALCEGYFGAGYDCVSGVCIAASSTLGKVCTHNDNCTSGEVCTSGVCTLGVEDCNNLTDDDNDDLIDCLDISCNGIDSCEYGLELNCTDKFDNDGDKLIDCGDGDCGCTEVPMCTDVLPTCADGVDNDKDGLVDLADDNCEDWEDFEEVTSAPASAPLLGNSFWDFVFRSSPVNLFK